MNGSRIIIGSLQIGEVVEGGSKVVCMGARVRGGVWVRETPDQPCFLAV